MPLTLTKLKHKLGPTLLRQTRNQMRQHDRREIATIYGRDVSVTRLLYEADEQSMERWLITSEGNHVVAIGGIAPMQGLPGYCVWLVGTDRLDKLQHKRELLRLGKELIPRLLKRYLRLSNICSADKGQLWAMKQLGFEVTTMKGNSKVRFITCAL